MGTSAGSEASRRAAILSEIARLGRVLPGSITERRARCGNPTCRCQHEQAAWHGPYRLWTRKVAGKTVTKTLSAEQEERYRPWFANARRLAELVRELEQLGVATMAAEQGWDPPAPLPPDGRRARQRVRSRLGDDDA